MPVPWPERRIEELVVLIPVLGHTLLQLVKLQQLLFWGECIAWEYDMILLYSHAILILGDKK